MPVAVAAALVLAGPVSRPPPCWSRGCPARGALARGPSRLLAAVGGAVLALLVVAAAVAPAAPVLAALAAVARAGAALALALAAPSDGAPSAGAWPAAGAAGAAGLIPGPLTTTELTVTEPALAAGPLAVVAEGPPDGPASWNRPGRRTRIGRPRAATARRSRLLSHGVLLNRAGRAGPRGRASLE